MQLATIEMSKTEARKAFLEYRRSVRERHDAEDEQIMRGYRALASGHQLIRLSETLRAGGTEERRVTIRNWQNERELLDVRVPKLAVARADMKMAYTAGIGREGGLLVTTEFPRPGPPVAEPQKPPPPSIGDLRAGGELRPRDTQGDHPERAATAATARAPAQLLGAVGGRLEGASSAAR
jgi:hypothetical protein